MPTVIYVKLRNEGTDVWRPVQAEPVTQNVYRVLDQPLDDEDWPVAQNEMVECEHRLLSGHECLVAKASQTPWGKRRD